MEGSGEGDGATGCDRQAEEGSVCAEVTGSLILRAGRTSQPQRLHQGPPTEHSYGCEEDRLSTMPPFWLEWSFDLHGVWMSRTAIKARHGASDKSLKSPWAGGGQLILPLKQQGHVLDRGPGRPGQSVWPGHLGRSATASLGDSQQQHQELGINPQRPADMGHCVGSPRQGHGACRTGHRREALAYKGCHRAQEGLQARTSSLASPVPSPLKV